MQRALQPQDSILAVEGKDVFSNSDFRSALEGRVDMDTRVTISRNAEVHELVLVPETIEYNGAEVAGVGIDLAQAAQIRYPIHLAAWYGVRQTVDVSGHIFSFLGGMVADLFTSDPVDTDALSGPVGLAVVIKGAAETGLSELLQIAALLSVNLAVFNVLPMPLLDGGRIFFLIAERVRGKAISAKTEAIIYNVGFLLLISLVIVVTLKDIVRL